MKEETIDYFAKFKLKGMQGAFLAQNDALYASLVFRRKARVSFKSRRDLQV